MKRYKYCGFSFMALLPQKTTDPTEFIASLPNNALANLICSAVNTDVVVAMPEFTFDDTLDLRQILKEDGITSAFDKNTADLSNMIRLPQSYISGIKHKTHIEVDRNGTRAAAVTELVCCAGCWPQELAFEVKLDRPFVFAIVHDETSLPLFIGIVNTLKQKK